MRTLVAAALSLFLTFGTRMPVLADQEQDIGKQVYSQLGAKGEIITHSPLYTILGPIAARIKQIADPQYDYPFNFILVHEKGPNAFAVPGGNVYVTDSLLRFVQNQQELAGVLCHETSHDMHHDVINNMRKNKNLEVGATVLSLLLGKAAQGVGGSALNFLANAQAQSYSRAVETAADQTGADTCAEAGFNPWGMIWLLRKFSRENAGTFEMLSDHPRDDHRISDLERYFAEHPKRFGHFSPNITTAVPLKALQNPGK